MSAHILSKEEAETRSTCKVMGVVAVAHLVEAAVTSGGADVEDHVVALVAVDDRVKRFPCLQATRPFH